MSHRADACSGIAGPLLLYGGSFDPVHDGHLQVARQLCDLLHPDRLDFLPAARSPLKGHGAPAADRLTMLRLALAGEPKLGVDTRELDRPPPSFTIDTLRSVRRETGPDRSIAFILGLDSLLALSRWRDWRLLTDEAHLIVVHRPGERWNPSPELAEWLNGRRCDDPDLLECSPCGRVFVVDIPPRDVSSTAIRHALARGDAPETLPLPSAVARYIRQHPLLYGAAPAHEPCLQPR